MWLGDQTSKHPHDSGSTDPRQDYAYIVVLSLFISPLVLVSCLFSIVFLANINVI